MRRQGVAAIVRKYPKATCHLNRAHYNERLGLIVGSGISDDLHIPKWTDLLRLLEQSLRYPDGSAFPESNRAEQLYQCFCNQMRSKLSGIDGPKLNAAIGAEWRNLVSQCLYRKYVKRDRSFDQTDYRKQLERHPYLKQLAYLAASLQLVVSHNFDDAVECAIDLDTRIATAPGRRHHSFWRPEPFLRRGMVNIYHPNGYIPFAAGVKGSESVILTEGSFADHLANTNTIETNFMLRHLADKTCLIIGHSLSDGTLKNALRLHANQRPGHVNYYVHWIKDRGRPLSRRQMDAIQAANFDTYNLVTLFATSTDIRELLSAIGMRPSELEGRFAHHHIPCRYVYYISGPVSAGKSTILGQLRNLETVEEWPTRMPSNMTRPSVDLTKDAEARIDASLEDAIWRKNNEIDDIKVGLVAVDRAPLDYVAFPAKPSETIADVAKRRTKKVLKRLQKESFTRLIRGEVIIISATEEILVDRQLRRGRIPVTDLTRHLAYVREQQRRMIQAYTDNGSNGRVVKSDHCSVAKTVKDVAIIMHFGPYDPFDFAGRLNSLRTERSAFNGPKKAISR